MSTFLGLVEEIPGISIDCFDEENLNSSAFFLSHCHRDHMKGLNYSFFESLKTKNNYFYCSHISKSFLENSFSNLDAKYVKKYLIELPVDESRIIEYIHNGISVSITVTCISAGHCPGSVMFLLAFNDKKILYTGDFRIHKEDFSKLKSLHYGKYSIPLKIDKIYLDTTFLNLNFRSFPSRLDSLRELCIAVKDWIERHPRNVVILEISALYGSEFIYIELSKLLNKKIHVKNNVYKVYSRMDVLANHVTDISEITSIHACMNKMHSMKNSLGLICRPDVCQENILTIVPSVQKWIGKDTSCIIEWDKVRKQTKNICYSTHASYDELEAFIQYFKPKEVFPCVCDETNEKEIHNLLKLIMQNYATNISSFKKTNKLTFSNYKTSDVTNFNSSILSDDEDGT